MVSMQKSLTYLQMCAKIYVGGHTMINLGKLNYNAKEIILEERGNGCIECVSHSKDDFGYTRIKYKGKPERLFRVIYQMKYGDIPQNQLIRHKCDNPSCCNIEHLEIGTKKDNYDDMVGRGRSKFHEHNSKMKGINNNSNKLSEGEVRDIYLSKLSNRKLAKIYNVSNVTISYIRGKKMWAWFTDEIDKNIGVNGTP